MRINMKTIKKYKLHIIYIPIIFFLISIISNMAGQNKGLQEKEMILKNIACSLPQEEFFSVVNSLSMPSDLKRIAGENHEGVWNKVKKNLENECYG